MRQIAFTMKVKPGQTQEYKRRHDNIWPELKQLLTDAGISDYSIFLDPDSLTLFAVQKQGGEYDETNLPDHPVMQKWWEYMADIMETHPDNSPVVCPLEEVFHMD